jgi:hypothetical protein
MTMPAARKSQPAPGGKKSDTTAKIAPDGSAEAPDAAKTAAAAKGGPTAKATSRKAPGRAVAAAEVSPPAAEAPPTSADASANAKSTTRSSASRSGSAKTAAAAAAPAPPAPSGQPAPSAKANTAATNGAAKNDRGAKTGAAAKNNGARKADQDASGATTADASKGPEPVAAKDAVDTAPEAAETIDDDGPDAEVVPLNRAARRAKGKPAQQGFTYGPSRVAGSKGPAHTQRMWSNRRSGG